MCRRDSLGSEGFAWGRGWPRVPEPAGWLGGCAPPLPRDAANRLSTTENAASDIHGGPGGRQGGTRGQAPAARPPACPCPTARRRDGGAEPRGGGA